MNWRDISLRIRAVLFRKQFEQDLEDELASHFEMQTRKNLAQGMDAAEAKRQAAIQFGGRARVSEECRDARGVHWITTLFQDAVYAARGLRRSPIFAATAVATIALGLGLDTALFTVFNAYYFAPVNVRDPHSLYDISWRDRAGGFHGYAWPEYQEFLSQNPPFSEVTAYQGAEVRLNGRAAYGLLVTAEYFAMLGGHASLGRTLLPEDAPGNEIVLSHLAWQNRFGSDPAMVGKTLLLHGRTFRVLGIAQAGFRGLGARPVDFWVPLTAAAQINGRQPDLFGPQHPRSLTIIARLKPEYGSSQSEAAATLWIRRLTAGDPDSEKAVQAVLTSVATYKPWKPSNTLTFAPILVAFSLVLLLGCANVANMMLARALSRQRELGIRVSLGASRARLIRQLLTESAVLALPAAAAGFAASQFLIWISIHVLYATLPPGIAGFAEKLPELSPDLRVFGYNLAIALASAVLFGLAPALRATRKDVIQAVQGDIATAFGPSRLRNLLVVAQVTVCALLLITTGVLLRGVLRAEDLSTSLSKRETIEIVPDEDFRARTLDRVSRDPAVDLLAAALTSPVARPFFLTVRAQDGGALLKMSVNSVSPEYFTLFDLPVLRGRNFTREEARAADPVVIVSHTAAQRLWPNQDPVGRSLRLVPDSATSPRFRTFPTARVIGVSRDDLSRWITDGEERTLIYFPSTAQAAGNVLFAGVRSDVETARRSLDAGLAAIDPSAAVTQRFQVRDFAAEEGYTFRLAYWATSAIGLLALLLTLTGIYGVVAFLVSQRKKEIGIRMALGATSGAISGLIVKQSMRLALIGTASGAALALGVSKALSSSLVIINTFDALTYLAGVLLVLAACAFAAYFPTRRATRIDPVASLRYD